jgi:hypothetical protein
VQGGLAYLADRTFGLRIVDVSDLLNLPQIGALATPGGPLHVAVVGGLAYLVDGYSLPFHHLRIADVSNPQAPVEVGALDTLKTKGVVTVVGGIAYLSGGFDGVRAVDVSNPQAPVEVGAFAQDYYSAGRAEVVDGLTYVARSHGLQIIDFGPEYQERCQNGIDDDGDGLADFPDDPGCADPLDLSETNPSVDCDDGFDNDGDGRVDFDPVTHADPGDETSPPAGEGDPGCRAPTATRERPLCQNGLDDDGDGKIDYDAGLSASGFADPAGPDPQCSTPWRNSETPSSGPSLACGLGAESLLLLPPLMWLWRRRTRAAQGSARSGTWLVQVQGSRRVIRLNGRSANGSGWDGLRRPGTW